MKLNGLCFNLYGLRTRLGITLVTSTVICLFVFLVLNMGLEYLFFNYYEHSDFESAHIQRQRESLQSYIDAKQISTRNLNLLKQWERKQPVILLELYEADKCIYSSIYDVPVSSLMLDKKSIDMKNCITIRLSDLQVTAFLFSDFTYQYNIIKITVSVVVSLILFILLFFYSSSNLIRYICRLNEEVQILEGGNLEYSVSEEGNDEITDLAHSMNRMRVALQQQIENEHQLMQTNLQLVTEMSHDLRTPLTGIMLYLEVLRSHRYKSEEELQDYLEKIDSKAHHMKLMSDHLFKYSMHNALQKQLEPQSMEVAFRYAVTCMQNDLKAQGFSMETDLEWKNCFVYVKTEYIHRIFENLVSNIEKYAEKSSFIRIGSLHTDKYCGFSVMNTFSTVDSQVESNGIGIESIRSMMKQMDGICNVEQTDSTFEITLLFPIQ